MKMDFANLENGACVMQFKPQDVTVATVTYGKRWHLLRQVLAQVQAQGALRAVVVDNASAEDIPALAAAQFGDFVHVVRAATNTGSAGGFKLALQTAHDLPDTSLILVLDDDNKPRPDCLSNTCAFYNQEVRAQGMDNLAVQILRRAFFPDGLVQRKKNDFYGFTVMEIPVKIARRLPGYKKKPVSSVPVKCAVPLATYGGFFLHRSVLDRYGLPDERFYLYEDDHEFTSRIADGGGKIWFFTGAEIEDIDISWWNNKEKKHVTTFESLLNAGQLRAFYCLRNYTYREKARKRRVFGKLFWRMNMLGFLALLFYTAVKARRLSDFKCIYHAIQEGEKGHLGRVTLFDK